MATLKKRINISLPRDVEEMLGKISKRDRVPRATMAAGLLRLALELEEDQVWDALARGRDEKGARFMSHKKAWA